MEFSKTYELTQNGKTFTSSEKIKINRYSNKTERILFNFDGTIPAELKLFAAWKNPQTGATYYDPILHGKDGYYVIIGTAISFYVGKWGLTVCGVEQDYNIDETTDVDETLIFWVSDPFPKIVVVQGLIDDDAVKLSYPNIDKELLDLYTLHENVVELAAEISADKQDTEDALVRAEEILTEMQGLLTQAENILVQSQGNLTQMQSLYNTLSASLRSEYEQYAENLR